MISEHHGSYFDMWAVIGFKALLDILFRDFHVLLDKFLQSDRRPDYVFDVKFDLGCVLLRDEFQECFNLRLAVCNESTFNGSLSDFGIDQLSCFFFA